MSTLLMFCLSSRVTFKYSTDEFSLITSSTEELTASVVNARIRSLEMVTIMGFTLLLINMQTAAMIALIIKSATNNFFRLLRLRLTILHPLFTNNIYANTRQIDTYLARGLNTNVTI